MYEVDTNGINNTGVKNHIKIAFGNINKKILDKYQNVWYNTNINKILFKPPKRLMELSRNQLRIYSGVV